MPRKITKYITRNVVRMDENQTVLDAAKKMAERYIGSIVVNGSDGGCGLFTERDLLMKVTGQGKDPAKMLLRDVASRDTPRVDPDEKCSRCLELMKEHRTRHLMVFENNKFVGIVALRAMVQLMIEEKEELIGFLEQYITGSLE